LASGVQTDYNIDDITKWTDTQIRVRVPIGSYYNTPTNDSVHRVSASSGYVRVIHKNGEESENQSFSIPFSYQKEFWYNNTLPIKYYINRNSFNISGVVESIQSAADTWNSAVPQSIFTYLGDTDIAQIAPDNKSILFIGPESDFDDPNITAPRSHILDMGFLNYSERSKNLY
jgi:hypothetical protein